MDHPLTLASLGWSNFFLSQLDEADLDLTPIRISGVHRARIDGLSAEGPVTLSGVIVETDDKTGLCVSIAPLRMGGVLFPTHGAGE